MICSRTKSVFFFGVLLFWGFFFSTLNSWQGHSGLAMKPKNHLALIKPRKINNYLRALGLIYLVSPHAVLTYSCIAYAGSPDLYLSFLLFLCCFGFCSGIKVHIIQVQFEILLPVCFFDVSLFKRDLRRIVAFEVWLLMLCFWSNLTYAVPWGRHTQTRYTSSGAPINSSKCRVVCFLWIYICLCTSFT